MVLRNVAFPGSWALLARFDFGLSALVAPVRYCSCALVAAPPFCLLELDKTTSADITRDPIHLLSFLPFWEVASFLLRDYNLMRAIIRVQMATMDRARSTLLLTKSRNVIFRSFLDHSFL